MYCYIQYIEVAKNEEVSINTNSSLSVPQSVHTLRSTPSTTAVTTNKLIVNPNCPAQILLDYVCTQTGIDKNCEFDFCDIETGEMVGIKHLKPWSYATNVLKSKQTYIIVFCEKDEFGQYIKMEPFMNRQSRQYSEMLLKITRQLNSSKRLSATAARKGKHGSTSSRGSTSDTHKDLTQKKGSIKKTISKNF